MLLPRTTSVAAVMGGAPGGGGGHRYWRINMTANGGGSVAALLEMQFHTEANGFGLDSLEGGTESASSSFGSGHDPTGAIDDNLFDTSPNNSWASTASSFPHWWKYDYGAGNECDVCGVGIIARAGSNANQVPTAFDIQWSDDNSAWTTKWSETGLSWSNYQWQHFLDGGAASYTGSPHGAHAHWRIVPFATDGGTVVSFTEIEMRATPGGSDQCTGGAAISDGDSGGGQVDDNAFDNNNATLFASTTGIATTAYIGYSFASPVEVAQITLRNRQDGFANQAPTQFIVQYADSASGPWTTAWYVTGSTGWSLSETRTFTDPYYV